MKTLQVLLVLLVCSVVQAAQYTVTDLGTLGGQRSEASAINENGVVVGWAENASQNESINGRAFWYNGTMHDLGVGYASDINDSGKIVGYNNNGAFMYDGQIHNLGISDSTASGINNNGVIIGHTSPYTSTPQTSFVINGGNVTYTPSTFAFGVNDAGRVVGCTVPTPNTAYISNNGNLQLLTIGQYSNALDINSSNNVVGWYMDSTGTQHALFYDGQAHDLGTLGYDVASARAINDLNQIVGSSGTPNYGTHAFLYANGTMLDLNTLVGDSSWVLQNAMDINNKGQIVGYGIHNGNVRSFLLTPTINASVPEPSVFLLIFSASLIWFLKRK